MKKLELEEKIITAKHIKEHKKIWNILTYGVLGITIVPQLIFLVLHYIGELVEILNDILGKIQERLRDNIYKLLYYKELPTFKEQHGMTKKEWFAEDDDKKIHYVD